MKPIVQSWTEEDLTRVKAVGAFRHFRYQMLCGIESLDDLHHEAGPQDGPPDC
jgi:hypothetical protein